MRTLLDDLGFPELAVAPPAVGRQRDELNAEWAARFRASPSATTTTTARRDLEAPGGGE